MTKSAFARNLDVVEAQLARFLKPLGYRKHGRTFNRDAGEGLVQVINLQMGAYPIGIQTEITPSEFSLYGRFTVNLGVFVPELWLVPRPNARVLQEYDCALRARIAQLWKASGERWWDLSADSSLLSTDLVQVLDSHGLPFLERFATRDAVVREWIPFSETHGLSARSRVDVAVIRAGRGEHLEARRLLQEQRCRPSTPRQHAEYVDQLSQKLGLGPLDPCP